MAAKTKIGLFGGTFDPIHKAHLTVAGEAAAQFGLDRVLFVPAAHPPHKSEDRITPYAHRFRMVELACAGDDRFVASPLEAGEGKSYSVLTIRRLRELEPEAEIYFLIGADAFAEVTSWKNWEEVVESVRFIVVTRPGHEYRTPPGARVERLDTVAIPVSSSDIRARLAAGEDVEELPPDVLAYIRREGLYRSDVEKPGGAGSGC